MTIRQIHYTSTETGLTGRKGFQIKAVSPGISESLLREVEAHCSYTPPPTAPTTPSTQEIQGFPVSFQSKTLSDGTLMVMSTRYIGKDYSGRYGNFFSHALLIDDVVSALWDHLPVELWKSDAFLSEELSGTELPVLEEVSTGSEISLHESMQFLKRAANGAVLAQFLASIEHAIWENRKLVIAASSDVVAQWIAIASFVFPAAAVMNLSYNTYAGNPLHSDHVVIGTTTDSDFIASSGGFRSSFAIFRAEEAAFESDAPATAFSSVVDYAWRSGQAEAVFGFPEFSCQLTPEVQRDELAGAFAHYCTVCGIQLPSSAAELAYGFASSRKLQVLPETLFRLLVTRISDDPKSAPSRLDEVYQYATDKKLEGDTATKLDELVVHFILQELIRTANSKSLFPLVDVLIRRRRRLSAGEILADLWMEAMNASSEDPTAIALLISIGNVLELNDVADQYLVQAGELIIGPQTDSIVLQEGLIQVSGNAWASRLFDGIASWLMSQVHHESIFRERANLLGATPVFSLLAGYADRECASLLYLRIAATSEDECRKGFTELCQRAGEISGEVSQLELQLAYGALWSASNPTIREIHEVLESPWADKLADTSIPSELVRAISSLVSLNALPTLAPVLHMLSRQPYQSSLDLSAQEILCGLNTAVALAEGDARQVPSSDDLVDLLSKGLPMGIRAILRKLAAERLMSVQELRMHVKDAQLLISSDPEFITAYLDAVQRTPRSAGSDAMVIARAFILGQKCSNHDAAAKLREAVVRMALRISEAGNRRVKDLLDEFDPHAAAAWESRERKPKVQVFRRKKGSVPPRLLFIALLLSVLVLAAMISVSLSFCDRTPDVLEDSNPAGGEAEGPLDEEAATGLPALILPTQTGSKTNERAEAH